MTENCVDGDCMEIVLRTVDKLVLIIWKHWYGLLGIQYWLEMVAGTVTHDGDIVVYLQNKFTVTYLQKKTVLVRIVCANCSTWTVTVDLNTWFVLYRRQDVVCSMWKVS